MASIDRLGYWRRISMRWCAVLGAALCVGAVQAQEAPQMAPYPPNAYRCAVLAGGATTHLIDANFQGFWREVNRDVTRHLAARLRAGTYDIDEAFTELSDEGKQPSKALMAVSSSRCAQLIQIAHDIGQDKDGPYFAFDIKVMRFRSIGPAVAAMPGTSVLPLEDYSKHYRYARSAEVFQTMSTAQIAEVVLRDLIASGVIDGIKGAAGRGQ